MSLRHAVREIGLSTGAKGLIINTPDSTSVSYLINFRAGNKYVRPSAAKATAHVTEHMMFGPSQTIVSQNEYSRTMSRNGAFMNATTNEVYMNYYTSCPDFDWQRVLKVQQEMLASPKFLPGVLEVEKNKVRLEQELHTDNAMRALWYAVHYSMGGNVLSDTVHKNEVDTVALGDVMEHHRRTHTHRNMRFIIAGNFGNSESEVIEMLESWNLKAGKRLPLKRDSLHSSGLVGIPIGTGDNIRFIIAYTASRTFTLPELAALQVLEAYLFATHHSRIFGTARTRGLCYGLKSTGGGTNERGLTFWEISGDTTVDKSDALFGLIAEQTALVVRGEINDTEFNEAKLYALGRHRMRAETVTSLIDWYSSEFLANGTIRDIDQEVDYLKNTTREDIIRLAREFFVSKQWGFGEVGAVDAERLNRHYELFDIVRKGN